MKTEKIVRNDNTPIEPTVLKPKIGPNHKERRRKYNISEPNYQHVPHSIRHSRNQATRPQTDGKRNRFNPKARTKRGNGLGGSRPGRGYEQEVKLQKIIAGMTGIEP